MRKKLPETRVAELEELLADTRGDVASQARLAADWERRCREESKRADEANDAGQKWKEKSEGQSREIDALRTELKSSRLELRQAMAQLHYLEGYVDRVEDEAGANQAEPVLVPAGSMMEAFVPHLSSRRRWISKQQLQSGDAPDSSFRPRYGR